VEWNEGLWQALGIVGIGRRLQAGAPVEKNSDKRGRAIQRWVQRSPTGALALPDDSDNVRRKTLGAGPSLFWQSWMPRV
jgi:hypothetical protein